MIKWIKKKLAERKQRKIEAERAARKRWGAPAYVRQENCVAGGDVVAGNLIKKDNTPTFGAFKEDTVESIVPLSKKKVPVSSFSESKPAGTSRSSSDSDSGLLYGALAMQQTDSYSAPSHSCHSSSYSSSSDYSSSYSSCDSSSSYSSSDSSSSSSSDW